MDEVVGKRRRGDEGGSGAVWSVSRCGGKVSWANGRVEGSGR